ncbi:MAG TPA: hypothetical protein VE967_05160 [Gemmatimonadaceae bacterium]|nr:hypothetical protein [Gemmatimonadaceae bacterium]
MTRDLRWTRWAACGAAALALVAGTHLEAQTNVPDVRWEAWAGCWQSVAEPTASRNGVVCVTPLSGKSAIEIASIAAGKVTARDTVDVTGQQRAVKTESCTGWRRADWSEDRRRIYMTSEVDCGSSGKRTSTGLVAITANGDWLDIQSASMGGSAGLRTVRYRELGPWFTDLPQEFDAMVSGRDRVPYAARAYAGAGIGPKEVIEAATRVDSAVVTAWLAERRQKFNLDAKTLTRLADAGVAGSITDMMIATTYPSRFALEHVGPDAEATPSMTGGGGDNRPGNQAYARAQVMSRCSSAWDPYWYPQSAYDPCSYSAYRGYYGYSPYGYGAYGYYDPYLYSGYGYGYPYYGPTYYTSSGPIIIVKDPRPEVPHGRMINGQGYTRRDGGGNNSGSQASSGESSSRGSGSSSGSSSSGSRTSGSSSSGSSSSSGRTAQAKKGG